jgi:hypothetical protein
MNWICILCRRLLPSGYLKSRAWIGLCYRCDTRMNEPLIQHLGLVPVGKCPTHKFFLEAEE